MDFAAARFNMVESQIRTNNVVESGTLRALSSTPRELFLPRRMRGYAYADEDLPLGRGRVMIEPLVMARLLQAAAIRSSDVVLAIGDATGWGSAVLSKLASTVVSLECDGALAAAAAATLSEQGVDNVAVMTGDLSVGYPAQAPYDVILFLGAVAEIPEGIAAQLADGGRLVAVVAHGPGGGAGTRLTRMGAVLGRDTPFDAATPFLPGLEPKPVFRF
ncbi:protein-L-isoaspartate O-methyltransferase family protein [Magnetospirillum molischianum]|uniref:Protein-L-isoaspartate O-methyltransferase n=1 Tax=Magnetospirillum molischianum DSM 120 TaxID=1150626 RepID=H8FQ54_MAGML|nr:protein-L-isoaspartate O-methyltransferase [Magnetospirillum molischianum]CCG40492.1 Protein-L-isoaspartate carboxylmethyltransferase [Magnetospirillum molischianum DSM 120]